MNGASGEFITHFYRYDLLDHLVEEDVQADAATRLVTKHRYDRMGNRVLTLLPEQVNDPYDYVATIFDERGLVWKQTRAGRPSGFAGLFANVTVPEANTLSDSPLASTTTTDYTPAGLPETITDGEGNETEHIYDQYQRLVRTEDPLGNWREYEPDPAGQVVLATAGAAGSSAALEETETKYDELGRVFEVERKLFAIDASITVTDGPLTPGDGWVTTRTKLDRNGNAVQVVDDNRVSVTHAYDERNRRVRTEDPALNVTTIAYNKADAPIHIEEIEYTSTGALDGTYDTWCFYDQLGRKTAEVNEAGHAVRWLYDSRGNVVFQSDAKASSISVALSDLDVLGDHTGLPPLSVNDHGNTILTEYDDAGRVTATVRHMRVDGLGGNALVAGLEGTIVTAQSWDLDSRLESQTDDSGNTTSYQYDNLGRLDQTTFADGTTELRGYDKRGLLTSLTDANGSTQTNLYDDAGRMISRVVTIPQGSNVVDAGNETYTYDGLARLKAASDGDSTVARSYDSLGRVIQETVGTAVTVSVYDGVGLLKRLEYPGGRVVEQTYDSINRLHEVKSATGTVFAAYDWIGPSRLETRTMQAIDAAVSVSWDAARRPTTVHHQHLGGGSLIEERVSVWDRANNRVQRDDFARGITHAYVYDSAYRMVQSDRTGGGLPAETVLYALDGVGNRGSVTGGADPGTYIMLSSAPPEDEQMNQYSETAFDVREYDENGNLADLAPVGQPTANVEVRYDYKNRIVEWHDNAAGQVHTYAYDALGRRISKVVDVGGADLGRATPCL